MDVLIEKQSNVRGLITSVLILDVHKTEVGPPFNLSSAIGGGRPLIEYKGACAAGLLHLLWPRCKCYKIPG